MLLNRLLVLGDVPTTKDAEACHEPARSNQITPLFDSDPGLRFNTHTHTHTHTHTGLTGSAGEGLNVLLRELELDGELDA